MKIRTGRHSEVLGIASRSLTRLRVRAREKSRRLQELGETLEAAFDALREGILIIDQEMNVMVLNRYMRELFRIREDYQGKKCYQVIQGSVIPCRGSSCRRVMLKGEGEEEELVLIIDDEKRIFEVRTYPWSVREGAVRGVIRTFTDVTHRRAVEELQILAGVSKYMAHTVRNAIVPLGGYVRLIAKECGGEKTAPYFRIVERALEDLEDAVDEYTDFIKVKGDRVYESLDLMEVIQSLPELVKGEEAKKIGLNRYMDGVPLFFFIRPGSFIALGNRDLFTKGLLYMVKGGFQVCREFCGDDGSFEIEAEAGLGTLVLLGRLRGIEVPESLLVTMFQPWSHARQEPSFHHWSVAIFNEVVKKHGGKLVVRREEGSTIFHASFSQEGFPQHF
ncbi:MAG TPA: hypothetical protein ENF32_01875 [Thermosulfidibacter takaii]|uniref:PAS domain-containing protein n=1 Tax=Thermosulfidibacter takaii TaxID=412593 RepID=A0A7C0U6B2_9BACT|nr:hypothetical protein [Thermosulfidibacter takaii]